MPELPGYGKVWNLGHRAVADIFGAPVYIQEKIDGSQFSFGSLDGETVLMRSKGAEVFIDDGNKMFADAADYVNRLSLPPGVIFRGEVLSRPKHNSLTYSRVPKHNIILFDVQYVNDRGDVDPIEDLAAWADTLDLEHVPCFDHKSIFSAEMLREYFERESVLGGAKIEGVVCKRYDAWDPYDAPLRGKFVSEAFKEVHSKDWKGRNPNTNDIITDIVSMYATEARWEKAVQHLRDDGELEDSPRDIGKLIKAATEDVLAECKEEIMERCFRDLWRKGIGRGMTAGIAEWYKQRLLDSQFDVIPEPDVGTRLVDYQEFAA